MKRHIIVNWDKERKARLGLSEISTLETLENKSINEIFNTNTTKVTDIVKVLYVAFKKDDSSLTKEILIDLIENHCEENDIPSIEYASSLMSQLCEASFGKQEKKRVEEEAKTPQSHGQ